ncbi:Glycoside hydrolase, family 13, N-terminal [Dillenia turbinata]|uniref:Glycoside hydrolase, family 13, N-terminal n=1 Tax=Dillenia turbinata TaxID=194707 RepID=A0AAN8ZCZ7_9MAGN
MSSEVSASQSQDSLFYSRAFWVSKSIIAWNVNVGDGSCYLYASKIAALSLIDSGIEGEDAKFKLVEVKNGLPANVVEKFPHIRDYRAFRVPPDVDARSLLKCQLAVAVFTCKISFSMLKGKAPSRNRNIDFYRANGVCDSVTSLQLPGVLDELFTYDGPLGAVYSEEAVSLYLWAPTAQKVHARIFKDPSGGDLMDLVRLEEANGVWSTSGPKSWEGCYYVYEVFVYHPSTLQIEKCIATDPYARGLSSDGSRTLFVNLEDEALRPDGWDCLMNEKPSLPSASDISIYELHIRDFSASDTIVDPSIRGGYLAFTCQKDSTGMLHLKKLSDSGLTHVHLLPTFQFAEVDDDKKKWKSVGKCTYLKPILSRYSFGLILEVSIKILVFCVTILLNDIEYLTDMEMLETLPPDSDEQQAQITAIQNEDGYNWGYNPVLWGVPKGSYASNPNGPCRILEFRNMVQALNRIGLRVVLDVVYNHLHANGPSDQNSVLDKIVPGYYLRRNADGFIENSTCVNNTASEHNMVERLIIDDLLCWAVNYKIDGFRFDLMGHIMKRTMVSAKKALQDLSKDKNGVDGSNMVKDGTLVKLHTMDVDFNDRIRDAMLGGSPFGHPLQQGFVTGLSLEPNGHDHGTEAVVARMLAISRDHIQVGIAANLRDFVLTNCDGEEVKDAVVKGSEVLTHDSVPVAYASQPTETINYVSAHDNETLFDIVSLKTPMEILVDDRCRMNHLATIIIALSQGIPFFHAGDEMLRSKSLDRDSYNSGDWFNRLDFSYNSNNWGVGLPPREKNERNWPIIRPRLANPSFKPGKNHILAAVENFSNILKIRYSTPLFRLRTSKDIQERLCFHNTGPSAVPGVIVMSIEDGTEGVPGLAQLDPIYSYIVVVFNVCSTEISFSSPGLRARSLQLHPVQLTSTDNIVKNSTYDAGTGSFTVPARTTAILDYVRES